MARRPPGRHTSARWLAGAAVAALAVAAIVLAVIAIERVRPASTGPQREPAAPSFSFGPTSPPQVTESAPPTTAPVAIHPASEDRFLSVGSGAMWRGVAGECGGTPPRIERSTDGGSTWQDVTPLYRGIGEILSLDSFAGSQAESIARMGGACDVQALRTFTQGQFWEPYPEILAASSYLDPSSDTTVITPQGPISTPCAQPRSFRSSAGTMSIVCDGTGFTLANGQWAALPLPAVKAVGNAGGRLVAAALSEGCEGLAVSALSGAGFAEATPLGCVAVDPAAPVAVAPSGDGATVWSGDAVIRLP